MPGVEEIVFIDPDTERFRIVRQGEEGGGGDWLAAGGDLKLVSLDIVVPYAEVFAED